MTLSAAEVYNLLDAYPVKVRCHEGEEFFCLPRCHGFHRGMQEVVQLNGVLPDGSIRSVSLYRDQLERGGRRHNASTLKVYDRDGVTVKIQFFDPVSQFYGNQR